MNRPALYWEALEKGAVCCRLCPHNCVIGPSQFGFCGARQNTGGELIAASYSRVSSLALDPIEKKPLRLFKRGSAVLSIGSFGCNLRCGFCQNASISAEYGDALEQADTLPPEALAAFAVTVVEKGNIGVAYTYNEPLIGYEYVLDAAKLVRAAGLSNILVTNGFINSEPLQELLPFIDAMNIDLKGFTAGFYERVFGGLDAVKQTITAAARRCHVEVTTLVIPGENEADVEPIAEWIASVDPDIPLHLTRFFPRYKYVGKEPTRRETLQTLAETAKKHLKHVFAGNV